jgi:hypothetical protein
MGVIMNINSLKTKNHLIFQVVFCFNLLHLLFIERKRSTSFFGDNLNKI